MPTVSLRQMAEQEDVTWRTGICDVSVTRLLPRHLRDCGWDTSGFATVWPVGTQPKIHVSWGVTLCSWGFLDVSKHSCAVKTSVTVYQSTQSTRPF
jgi:hypothetical protein